IASHTCPHVNQIRPVTPNTEGCEECLATGDRWVELRLCLTCGHVGCCDSSKNKHATKHFHASGHPHEVGRAGGELGLMLHRPDPALCGVIFVQDPPWVTGVEAPAGPQYLILGLLVSHIPLTALLIWRWRPQWPVVLASAVVAAYVSVCAAFISGMSVTGVWL